MVNLRYVFVQRIIGKRKSEGKLNISLFKRGDKNNFVFSLKREDILLIVF